MDLIEASWFVADYNGVVVNDGPKGHRVFSAICEEYGVKPPAFSEFRKFYSSGPIAANLHAHEVPGEFAELDEKVREYWPKFPPSKLMKGAWETLMTLREHGIPRALVTRLNSAYAEASIRKRNLEQLFSPYIYTGVPDKRPYLRALSFQAGPGKVLFVTDTVLDIEEAKEVGCIVGAFTQGWGWSEALRSAKPHFVFGTWPELFDHVRFVKP